MMRCETRFPAIYLCGPIASTGSAAKGGFQSNNRRTINALRQRGVNVHTLAYPEPEQRSIVKIAQYAFGFTRLAWQTLSSSRNSVFHLTGLYKHFIYIEFLLILLARVRSSKTIYDIRAGSAESYYSKGGWIYRWCFEHVLKSAHLVLIESEALAPFVEPLVHTKPIPFPNHIDLSEIPDRNDSDISNPSIIPMITYAGSIRAEKGVETILEACRLLRRSNFPVSLQIAGSGHPNFIGELKSKYRDLAVTWVGPQCLSTVMSLYSNSHFFLFPTSHPGEGHSNSLTEAMACGCVPIVSNHGFNSAVVGDCGRVLAVADGASAYADALQTIWREKEWYSLSRRSQRRVATLFSSEAIVEDLIGHYMKLARANE